MPGIFVLSHETTVTAVLTDDSDIFIFGATHVIRNPDLTDWNDEIAMYTMDAIRNSPAVSLTQGGLLLVALLSGGDYDPAGLLGFGPHIAFALAQSNLGNSLLRAVLEHREDLPDFLVQWWEDLCQQLCTDSGGHLGKRYIGLSTQVPDTFPNMEIVEAYVSPVTSWSDGDNGPDLAPLSPEFPDVAKIAAFCERVFTWGGPEGTLKKLQNTLWEGMSMTMLRDLPHSYSLQPLFTPEAVEKIKMQKLHKLSTSLILYRISVSTKSLNEGARSGFTNLPTPKSALDSGAGPSQTATADYSDDNRICLLWVPAPILQAALPAMVEAYSTRKGSPDATLKPEPLLPVRWQLIIDVQRDIIDLTMDENPSVGTQSASSSFMNSDIIELMDDGSW